MAIVSPSLLAADRSNFSGEIIRVRDLGATWIHYDMMDGIFVPNFSFPKEVINETRNIPNILKDVHIMIDDPLNHVEEYIDAGAELLTFHFEAVKEYEEIAKTIAKIKHSGIKVGLSIKPKTSPEDVIPFIKDLDLVLVMSVEPGLGGQKFMPNALDKISYLRKYIDEHNLKTLIEVDGGINGETGKMCIDAGVDVLVAGTYLYGHDDIEERINKLLEK